MAVPMNRRRFLGMCGCAATMIVLWQAGLGRAAAYPFTLSDAEWRRRLSPLAYQVLRKRSTEYPFTSPLNKEHRTGIFACAGCGQRLFSSKTKRSEEHTSELQSLMRISYAVFCMKTKKHNN